MTEQITLPGLLEGWAAFEVVRRLNQLRSEVLEPIAREWGIELLDPHGRPTTAGRDLVATILDPPKSIDDFPGDILRRGVFASIETVDLLPFDYNPSLAVPPRTLAVATALEGRVDIDEEGHWIWTGPFTGYTTPTVTLAGVKCNALRACAWVFHGKYMKHRRLLRTTCGVENCVAHPDVNAEEGL